jgi:hypothetical protein
MTKLQRDDLWTLEAYAKKRPDFRKEVMTHKKDRQIQLGDHVRMLFEDEKTIRYQIQEMLRIEKVFEEEGIQDELDAYNPLIPDGNNWKCTMMIEFPDIEERRSALAKLIGIEDKIWMRVGDHSTVLPIANEDLERSTEEKTSSVHFMRFQLTADMIASAKNGEDIWIGVDHPQYATEAIKVPEALRVQLSNDLAMPH